MIQHPTAGLRHFSARRFDRCANNEWLADFGHLAKPHRHLSADAKPPPSPRRGPDHRFIEHRHQNPAMNDAFKADVLRFGCEVRFYLAGGFIHMKMQMQPMRILPAADKTPCRMGKLDHGHAWIIDDASQLPPWRLSNSLCHMLTAF